MILLLMSLIRLLRLFFLVRLLLLLILILLASLVPVSTFAIPLSASNVAPADPTSEPSAIALASQTGLHYDVPLATFNPIIASQPTSSSACLII